MATRKERRQASTMTQSARTARRKAAAADLKAGMTTAAVAKKHKLAEATLYGIRREYGIGITSHPERHKLREMAADAVREGKTLEEAMEAGQCNPNTVYRACKEFGVTVNFDGRSSALGTFSILRKLLDGLTVKTIAIEHGVSRQRVDQIRDKARAAGFTFTTTKENS